MLNIGILFLLVAVTACPSKEENEKVDPKNNGNELLGIWQWVGYGCANLYPSPIVGSYEVIFDNKNIIYSKNDTILFKTTYTSNLIENQRKLSIDFKGKLDSLRTTNHSYLFIDGEYNLSDSLLSISNLSCFVTLKKI